MVHSTTVSEQARPARKLVHPSRLPVEAFRWCAVCRRSNHETGPRTFTSLLRHERAKGSSVAHHAAFDDDVPSEAVQRVIQVMARIGLEGTTRIRLRS